MAERLIVERTVNSLLELTFLSFSLVFVLNSLVEVD